MKRLYLLRHAEALSTAQDDKTRHLSELGQNQAKELNKIMAERKYVPDYIACSDALRTKQTLELVYPKIEAVYPGNFYNASPGDLMEFIQKVDNAKEAIMIVNHNPTIHKIAFMLSGESVDDHMQSLSMGFKPCSLAVLECPITRWSDLSMRENKLIDLIPPQC